MVMGRLSHGYRDTVWLFRHFFCDCLLWIAGFWKFFLPRFHRSLFTPKLALFCLDFWWNIFKGKINNLFEVSTLKIGLFGPRGLTGCHYFRNNVTFCQGSFSNVDSKWGMTTSIQNRYGLQKYLITLLITGACGNGKLFGYVKRCKFIIHNYRFKKWIVQIAESEELKYFIF